MNAINFFQAIFVSGGGVRPNPTNPPGSAPVTYSVIVHCTDCAVFPGLGLGSRLGSWLWTPGTKLPGMKCLETNITKDAKALPDGVSVIADTVRNNRLHLYLQLKRVQCVSDRLLSRVL